MVDVWCLPGRKTAQHRTVKKSRCGGNWGCNERLYAEVAWNLERKGDAKLVVERTAPVGRPSTGS